MPARKVTHSRTPAASSTESAADVAARVEALDWDAVEHRLDGEGCATVGPLLTADECCELRDLYSVDANFRRHILMARHGYGRGEYKYFSYPLPKIVAGLRTALYSPLAALANRWNAALGMETRYPTRHEAFQRRCHQAGQQKPTPLILRYEAGDFNCLHQDVYGEHVFPLQIAILLSAPGRDFSGGEFVLTEQRPRMQSRAEVVPLQQGMGVIFPVRHRPVLGKRGYHRVNMRHGVSRIRSGVRFTLGIIFHDAQ